MHLAHQKACRVCGSSFLTKVIDLGEQYLGVFCQARQKDVILKKDSEKKTLQKGVGLIFPLPSIEIVKGK